MVSCELVMLKSGISYVRFRFYLQLLNRQFHSRFDAQIRIQVRHFSSPWILPLSPFVRFTGVRGTDTRDRDVSLFNEVQMFFFARCSYW